MFGGGAASRFHIDIHTNIHVAEGGGAAGGAVKEVTEGNIDDQLFMSNEVSLKRYELPGFRMSEDVGRGEREPERGGGGRRSAGLDDGVFRSHGAAVVSVADVEQRAVQGFVSLPQLGGGRFPGRQGVVNRIRLSLAYYSNNDDELVDCLDTIVNDAEVPDYLSDDLFKNIIRGCKQISSEQTKASIVAKLYILLDKYNAERQGKAAYHLKYAIQDILYKRGIPYRYRTAIDEAIEEKHVSDRRKIFVAVTNSDRQNSLSAYFCR